MKLLPPSRTILAGLTAGFIVTVPAHAEDAVDYTRQIKPILAQRCYACHGALKQKAGLRLDTGEAIRRGSKDNPIVLLNNVAGSPLLERITSTEKDERMPVEGEPLKPEQIRLIEAWIRQGASSPIGEKPEPDPRDHWAFRPVQRPPQPPHQPFTSAKANAIDAFIDEALAREKLTPLGEAAPDVLLRRVYLDLLGLPPTRDELRAFLDDRAPAAYERTVDRLLADPRHAERWARHWMDVWRYSDWYGRRSVSDVWNSAPQIWRWRDWIVRSLHADKGYDRMVSEMLAADEIAPLEDDTAVATGFLIRNWYALNPNQWMRDNIEHTGKAFLGLTFNCAHCHDHKYDPISQDDYFRFRAIFEPIYVRQDRWPGEADPGPFQDYKYTTTRKPMRLGAVRIFDQQSDAKTWFYTGGDERNRVESKGGIAPGVPAFLGAGGLAIEPVALPKDAIRPGLRPAIQETELASRLAAITRAEEEMLKLATTPQTPETALAKTRTTLAATRAEMASSIARLAADQAKLDDTPAPQKLALATKAGQAERDAAVATAEAAHASALHQNTIAEAMPDTDAKARETTITAAKKAVTDTKAALDKAVAARQAPKSPETYTSMTATYPAQSTGRRKALAQWLTSRDNPLTARVAVNHLWMRHFQDPLVSTVFDFGRNGAKPAHPALLDWLAAEFMEHGWSMRHLHRLIVTSAAYRRTSHADPKDATAQANTERDRDNKFLWRRTPSRMEAELVRDSVLHLAGALDTTMGGQELENTEAEKSTRRSLYFSCHPETGGRSAMAAMFDAPEPTDCYRRSSTVLPQQALVLMNSKLVHDHSAALAKRLGQESETADAFITAAFEHILTRTPRDEELAACRAFIDQGGREGLVRVLLNHNDFITIR